MIKVIIGQRVVTKHLRFVGWQIKKGSALALGQNGTMRHVSFAILDGLYNFVLAMKYGTFPVPESDEQASLRRNLGFRAIRELLPGTAFMPGSGGGWIELSWAVLGRAVV
jgi:hypothetical protein